MSNKGRKLMLVDDDRLILATTASGLRAAGYDVVEASTVDGALMVLERFTPDLAVLDIRMGAVSGFDLARRLKEQRATPFMFLSAYGDDCTVAEATELGAVGFVVKPVDTGQLIPAIEAAFARAADLARLRSTGRQLEQALDQQRGVSVAVGILMERHRLTRDQAQDHLRDVARAQRRRMTELAEEVVGATEVLAAASFGIGRAE